MKNNFVKSSADEGMSQAVVSGVQVEPIILFGQRVSEDNIRSPRDKRVDNNTVLLRIKEQAADQLTM